MIKKNRPSNYDKVHYWLRKNYGSPKICELEDCPKKSKTFDWALKKGKRHEKIRDNYIRLCRQCHTKYDWNEEKTNRAIEITHTKEANENRSKSLTGRKLPQWVKEKISKGVGSPRPESVRKKISESSKGKKMSAETRKKMSLAKLKTKP